VIFICQFHADHKLRHGDCRDRHVVIHVDDVIDRELAALDGDEDSGV
jgi:hypothetical protein